MLPSPRQLEGGDWPALLHEIADPPKTLRIRGALPTDRMYLTVVGARKYSPYGRRACEVLVEGLRGYPIAIVSGLALGLDAIAHEAALRAGLPTLAILPSGLSDSSIYPASHRPLARRILEEGGALVSENADDARVQTWSFAERDRLMAGFSKATLIVEASERSGTLITARLAMEYNREVLVVPHPIGPSGQGGNALLRQGATLVRSAEDILEALGIVAEEKKAEKPSGLSPAEEVLYDALTEALERDDLIERVHLSPTEANIALSKLLLRGVIIERMSMIERT